MSQWLLHNDASTTHIGESTRQFVKHTAKIGALRSHSNDQLLDFTETILPATSGNTDSCTPVVFFINSIPYV